jgi:hypothetical protein
MQNCHSTKPKQQAFQKEESMCTYDMTSKTDSARLATDAGVMGRTIAHTEVFATRSDQVAHLARKECERALKTQSDLTNNQEAYRKTFVEAFVVAYFDELVFLRNQMKLV